MLFWREPGYHYPKPIGLFNCSRNKTGPGHLSGHAIGPPRQLSSVAGRLLSAQQAGSCFAEVGGNAPRGFTHPWFSRPVCTLCGDFQRIRRQDSNLWTDQISICTSRVWPFDRVATQAVKPLRHFEWYHRSGSTSHRSTGRPLPLSARQAYVPGNLSGPESMIVGHLGFEPRRKGFTGPPTQPTLCPMFRGSPDISWPSETTQALA